MTKWFIFCKKKKKRVKKIEKKIIDFQKNFLGREKIGFSEKKNVTWNKNRNMVTRLTHNKFSQNFSLSCLLLTQKYLKNMYDIVTNNKILQ